MPDDHSEVVPLLPIPNRTVKRASADDSADSRVKVGHRQAIITAQPPPSNDGGGFAFCGARKSGGFKNSGERIEQRSITLLGNAGGFHTRVLVHGSSAVN